MRILFLTNNNATRPLIDFLNSANENVVVWQDKITPALLLQLQPELIISYAYRHIIKEDVIRMANGQIINLHISMLPWNKGADPNFWSFIEDTPKGVTIHQVDKGVDTGPILLQKQIDLRANEHSLRTSYSVLQNEIQNLFTSNYNLIKSFSLQPAAQTGAGTVHKACQLIPFRDHIGPNFHDMQLNILKDRYLDYCAISNTGAGQ